MEVRPFVDRISALMRKYVGYRFTKVVALKLQMDISEILREAVKEACAERPYLIKAADLRGMGIAVPEHVPDRAFVPCSRPEIVPGNSPDKMSLRLELSYMLPPEPPAEAGDACPPTSS